MIDKKNVRHCREQKGLSQAELAEKIGQSRSLVQRLENENDKEGQHISFDGINKLSLALSIKPYQLWAEIPVNCIFKKLQVYDGETLGILMQNSPVLNLEFKCLPDNEEKERLLTIAEMADEIKAVNYWEELKIRAQLKRRFDIQEAADFLISREYEIWFSNVCRIEVETTAATAEAISWIDYISLFFWKSSSMKFKDSEYLETRIDTKRIGDGCLADPSDEELLLKRPEPFKDNSLFSFKNNSFQIKEREKSQ